MAPAVSLRTDVSAIDLRRLAAATRHVNQHRRLLSLAAVLDGTDRTQAARIGGMDRQTLRDWVHRFNEHGLDGLKDSWSKGNPPHLSADQRAELARLVETGPGGRRRGGALAADRPATGHPRALRRHLPRADRGQDRQGARLRPHQRPPAPSRSGRGHGGGVQANVPAALKAHVAHIAKSKAVEIWFQSLPRAQRRG